MDLNEILQKLSAPFSAQTIQWRVGATSKDKSKGQALAYIEARNVMDRLDQTLGLDWEDTYELIYEETYPIPPTNKTELAFLAEKQHPEKKITGVKCKLSIIVEGKKITKEGIGVLSAASELKGAESDSLKRAAIKFGIGRYIYKIPNYWVDLNTYKQIVQNPVLPDEFLPEEEKGKQGTASSTSYSNNTNSSSSKNSSSSGFSPENPIEKRKANAKRFVDACKKDHSRIPNLKLKLDEFIASGEIDEFNKKWILGELEKLTNT